MVLHRVLYVASLTKTLFSVPSFCINRNYTMSTSAQLNQFDFGDGTSLSLPIIRAEVEANNSEANTSDI
eukprot:11054073-Ditylum_brightwellii.AAC.1